MLALNIRFWGKNGSNQLFVEIKNEWKSRNMRRQGVRNSSPNTQMLHEETNVASRSKKRSRRTKCLNLIFTFNLFRVHLQYVFVCRFIFNVSYDYKAKKGVDVMLMFQLSRRVFLSHKLWKHRYGDDQIQTVCAYS